MIGLVVVTHGRLAEELVLAMEHVVGKQKNVRSICIGPDDNVEKRREEMLGAVEEVDTGDGVIVLTDMFGGTPSNLAIAAMGRGKLEVVAGINLPMMIKLATVRQELPLEEAALQAQESGRKYINVASNLLTRSGGPASVKKKHLS